MSKDKLELKKVNKPKKNRQLSMFNFFEANDSRPHIFVGIKCSLLYIDN